jgi:1,4-dihydroxy-2-naphthoate octaprenyltransferase
MPAPARMYVAALRPKTLTAALVPYLVGGALGTKAAPPHASAWGDANFALLGYLLVQVGTNLVNDACDFLSGADAGDRVGPTRVTQAGAFTPRAVHAAGCACFVLAAVAMAPSIAVRGWPIALLLVASCLAGYAYTGGPYPLGYHGLGEITVLAFFGWVAVGGMRHVHAGDARRDFFSVDTLVASAQVGALCASLLAINNLRDAKTDGRVGKNTLCVVFGETFARWEITALTTAPYLLNAHWLGAGADVDVVARRGGSDSDDATARLGAETYWRAAALSSLTFPIAIDVLTTTWAVAGEWDRARVGKALNGALARAAALHLFFGAALAAGVRLS